MMGCNWTEGKGCTKKRQHKRNGFCQFHYNIWFRRQRINNNEALTNTATGGGGAQLINHETVGLTDNRLLSVTDLSHVARRNTATVDDTLHINNETLSRTDNCRPSSNGDNNVSLAARGNTDISKKRRKKSALCKWTEGECYQFAQSNPKRFCSKHYSAWLLIQVGGGGAPAINNNTIGRGREAGGGGSPAAPAINNGTIGCREEAGSSDARAINNNTIGPGGGDAGGGGAPAINNDTISREREAGGRGSPAALVINNDTIGREEQTDDSYYSQRQFKLLIEEIKEMKKMLCEQQQLQSRDEKIRDLESNIYDIRCALNTIVEHMRDQQTSVNITTNKSSNSIQDEVRNEIDFNIGCTTETTSSRSISTFNFSQQNNNENNSNKETHETSDNEEHDSNSNQDSTVNCRRYLKRKANETSSCAQGDPQTKCPRNKEHLYYKEFPVQTRNARHIEKDGRTAGLLNNNVICYANAIFQLIANCNNLNEYLLNPPREEHQHFSLYYEFACVISAMISKETVDAVDSEKFMKVFLDICPQFNERERTYYVVVSTN